MFHNFFTLFLNTFVIKIFFLHNVYFDVKFNMLSKYHDIWKRQKSFCYRNRFFHLNTIKIKMDDHERHKYNRKHRLKQYFASKSRGSSIDPLAELPKVESLDKISQGYTIATSNEKVYKKKTCSRGLPS